MNYNEIVYNSFLDELNKNAGLLSKAVNLTNKALYNPKVVSASNYFAQHNGDIKAMALNAGGALGGKAAATMGAPKLGKTIQGLGTGLSEVFKATPG